MAMPARKPQVFIFGGPTFLGGADSKLHRLLLLLDRHCQLTVIPNDAKLLSASPIIEDGEVGADQGG